MRALLIAAAVALGATAAGCGDDRDENVRTACDGHGRVVAIDDEIVVCTDGAVVEVDEE